MSVRLRIAGMEDRASAVHDSIGGTVGPAALMVARDLLYPTAALERPASLFQFPALLGARGDKWIAASRTHVRADQFAGFRPDEGFEWTGNAACTIPLSAPVRTP